MWEDASSKVAYDKRRQYLLGSGLDSVMNYPFRNAVLAFLRGGDAREFVEDMEALRENYPKLAFMSLMNLIGTHDSARALTVLACDDADYSLTKSERRKAAGSARPRIGDRPYEACRRDTILVPRLAAGVLRGRGVYGGL
ncbi:hypothetical protein FACS1894217_14100 [Clostridia bacterium]|nr:hypothetical protein FACS1894217_14100 [Clostridia bacterium]